MLLCFMNAAPLETTKNFLIKYKLCHQHMLDFKFPVLHYPFKSKSLKFRYYPLVQGVLQGIKGQYLLLDTGVLNLRKFGGYEIMFGEENV
jgi:hypothetical protein